MGHNVPLGYSLQETWSKGTWGYSQHGHQQIIKTHWTDTQLQVLVPRLVTKHCCRPMKLVNHKLRNNIFLMYFINYLAAGSNIKQLWQ